MNAALSYKTACDAEKETVVNKSRFICYLKRVENFEQVEEELARIRKMHPSATHVCFGAITDVDGNEFRYGDDGEPTGTAGQPILAVLRGEKLCKTLAAVVRYFGGIKLGTGGLARAYGDSVKNALKEATVQTFTKKAVYEMKLDYTEYNTMLARLKENAIEIVSQDFADGVTLEIAVDTQNDAQKIIEGILKRECRLTKIDERYI